MTERKAVDLTGEICPEEGRDFTLPVISRKYLLQERQDFDYPVFRYHIRSGEIHAMNNLVFGMTNLCYDTHSVQLTFKDTEWGRCKLSLDSLSEKLGVLEIADLGRVALRKIKGEQLVMFDICLSKDIRLVKLEFPVQSKVA